MKNLIFAGTPEISEICLRALLAAGYNIQACLTQPDRPKGRGNIITSSPVKQLAEQHQIPVYQPEKLRNSEIPELLQRLAPDIMVVVAYGLIIPKEILAIPKYGCLNIHTSLLPRWRGAAPMQHAILAGDKQTGVTIMQMDPGMDTGDVLTQHPCTINDTTTTETLYQQLAKIGSTAIVETLKKLAANEITPIKQQDELATYAPKINKHDGEINWQQSAIEIDRQIRAFNPWPVAYTQINSTIVRIWQAAVVATPADLAAPDVTATTTTVTSSTPGTILAADKNGIVVSTATADSSALLLTEIQLPGKKRMAVKDILNSPAQQQLFAVGMKFEVKA